jgi:hypothetical protein
MMAATTDMRRCIGSKTFGIEAHDAPVADFPVQPSRKDGLGTLCKPHWNQYTSSLRKAANARKAAALPPREDYLDAKRPEDPNAPTEAELQRPAKPRRKAPMMAHVGKKATPAPKPRATKRAAAGTEVRPGMFKVGEGEYEIRDPLAAEEEVSAA